MIGTLGDVVFETSSEKIRTFDGMKRSGSARWATHDIMAHKPVLEFLGSGMEQISFSMRFDVSLGINPAAELETLRGLRDAGEASQLILNGKPIGEHKWVIESPCPPHRRLPLSLARPHGHMAPNIQSATLQKS